MNQLGSIIKECAVVGLVVGLLGSGKTVIAGSPLGFFELLCSNLDRAQNFYSQLFGWQFRKTSSENFMTIEGAGIPGGIIRDSSNVSGRPNAKLFFKVEQLRSKLKQAERLGAKTIIPPTSVSPISMIAEFSDLDNNIVGLICEARCSE